jgi:hypothetical protein
MENIETKQYTFEWLMGHWTNEQENQKVPRIKWKWEHNIPESMGSKERSSRMEIFSYKCVH